MKKLSLLLILLLAGCATSQHRVSEYKAVQANPALYSQMHGINYVNDRMTEYRFYKKTLDK